MTRELPYGTWPSPISAELLTRQALRLQEPRLAAGGAYWLEGRPQEGGRSVLMHCPAQGSPRERLPDTCNVRSRAHEYGGASYLVDGDDVFFVEAEDQRVYVAHADHAPRPLTEAGPYRYADFTLDRRRQRLLSVREDHSQPDREPTNTLVAIDLQGRAPVQILVQGHDFFSNPCLSPDGRQLAWLCWDHPDMPWDRTQCWLAAVEDDGELGLARRVAGEEQESVFQPRWSPAGDLYLVSDRSNWWNLYRVTEHGLTALLPMEAEFATPQWVFGMSTYDFLGADELLACASRDGTWQLWHLRLSTGETHALPLPWTDIDQLQCHAGQALCLAASPDSDQRLYRLQLDAKSGQLTRMTTLARASDLELDPELVSQPQALTFTTGPAAPPEPGANQPLAHGFYYAPRNPQYAGPQGARPPLIVLCHGGPTGATGCGLEPRIQYWTSRGFAVMDVNYRGSTGYGRAYRQQLNDTWGIHDVEDVCAAARHLVARGLADADKLIIKGSSAGGYTVLAALTFTDTFRLGSSLYGIGDLETLARDTHKFEARYLDSLVGPYPGRRDLYLARSPIQRAEALNCPVIFFQGLDDRVVPPNQAEAMVAVLKNKGIPVAYVPFEGEGHGFRRAENIRRVLEGELYFFNRLLGNPVPAGAAPVTVDNLAPGDLPPQTSS